MKKITLLAFLILFISFVSFTNPVPQPLINTDRMEKAVNNRVFNRLAFNPTLLSFSVYIAEVTGNGNCVQITVVYNGNWNANNVFGDFSVTANYGFRGNHTYNLVDAGALIYSVSGTIYTYYSPCVLVVPAGETYVSNTPWVFQGAE